MVLVGACAGIVGLDLISCTPRFTFDSFDFENGFQLIPALIGLFAMSEVLMKAFDREPLAAEAPPLQSSILRFA